MLKWVESMKHKERMKKKKERAMYATVRQLSDIMPETTLRRLAQRCYIRAHKQNRQWQVNVIDLFWYVSWKTRQRLAGKHAYLAYFITDEDNRPTGECVRRVVVPAREHGFLPLYSTLMRYAPHDLHNSEVIGLFPSQRQALAAIALVRPN